MAGSHLSRILVGCRRYYCGGYLSRSFSRVAGWCAPGVHLVSSFGVLAATFALDHDGGGLLWLSLAGFLAGVSLVTKQTAGVATTLSVGVALPAIIAARGRLWHGVRATTVFAIGWVIPVASTCAWLAAHGALRNFLSDAFLHGASSKGSLASLLERQVIGIAGSYYLRICAALALGAILLLASVYQRGGTANRAWPQRSILLLILGIGAMSTGVVVAVEYVNALPYGLQRPSILLYNAPLFLGELGSLILLDSVWMAVP